ncbi:hypothetical protein ACK8OR_05585 [Jannaschia sp. KMU-145]
MTRIKALAAVLAVAIIAGGTTAAVTAQTTPNSHLHPDRLAELQQMMAQ